MMSVNADQTKAKPDRRMSNLGSVAQNRKDSIANLEFMRNRQNSVVPGNFHSLQKRSDSKIFNKAAVEFTIPSYV